MSEVNLTSKLSDIGYNVDSFSTATIESFRTALAGIARGAQVEWIRLAQSRLNSSRADYINGLRQAESFTSAVVAGEPEYKISLVGRMPNNYEFGMPSFDMKTARPGWLGGGKVKTNKDGKRYISIPFRHSTSASPRFQYTGKAARANLKSELKTVVKSYGLDRMIKSATGQVAEGPVARVPKSSTAHSYLKGLTRIQKPSSSDPTRGSSMLMTFRTMSESSPEDSWIHPGLDGANLLPEVERWVDKEIQRIAEIVLGAA